MYSPPKILLPLLWPLSLIYGAVVVARAWLYKVGILRQKRLNGVVISVGNLTVGGTGKTPMVFYLAQRLFDRGKSLAILSRGYKGRPRTDERLPPATRSDLPVVLSDETWAMARHLDSKIRLGVGANRYAHGRALEEQGVDWFLLDDGFQHLRLHRDADIVLVDSTQPFGRGLLPFGTRREPMSAIARADIVVITRSEHAPAVETVTRRHTSAPLFHATSDLKEVVPGENSTVTAEPNSWLGKRVYAFCAIGNSDAFFSDLRRWGIDVVGQRAFRDHHQYQRADTRSIEEAAVAAGAELLLCTDKDTYNLPRYSFSKLPQYVCRITMKIHREAEFWDALYGVIAAKRQGTHGE